MKKKSDELAAIRQSIISRAAVEQAEGKDVWDAQRKALARIEGFPVKRMVEIMQYLNEQILPAVQKRSGAQSQEAILFNEIVDVMIWALAVDDRREYLTRKIGSLKIENEILRDRLLLAEGELLKYQTSEELLMSDMLNVYLQAAKKRVEDLKKPGKK